MELLTNAEKRAEEARHLPAFLGVNLPDTRARVAEMLNLIGRVEAIFSTYTVHNISHIDAMLGMLDWLVPPSTAKAMSPADWLMVVISIYLHDLGMIVTAEEFHNKENNSAFIGWIKSLGTTIEGREYIARTERMPPPEKERFFFQEFIRLGHAARIREWITGRHSRTWGSEVKPISSAIAELLKPLPSRFRDYLGVVCESHHGDNLHRKDLFPLSAAFGSRQSELVNVQYAAILLRTTDLLHVTKDRTPSIAYQILRLSDPRAVNEWDKQLGVFVVRPKGRSLIEDDPNSAVIAVNADFTEERPLLALQEYVSYANAQIQQSKRWAAKSQEDPDAHAYSFPWHTVVGDVRIEGVPPLPLRFELDRGRLLNLLVGHTIYNDPTVAIRELLQNGIDAVRYQHYLSLRNQLQHKGESPTIGSVTVRWNPTEKQLTVEDDGIGMDRETIEFHLMKVGSSYYSTPQFEAENGDFSPISRFGIGILTCFMVSDDIEIITLRAGQGHRIRMTSVHSDYLLRELPLNDPLLVDLEPHGTRVILRLRATVDLAKRSILDILRYWVILPECPVLYIEAGKEPIRIGFENPAAALSASFHGVLPLAEEPDRYDFVIKTIAGQTATSSYELALLVEEGISSERSFVVANAFDGHPSSVPAVCIEGIRVAETLPWARPGASLGALVSVRGDRGLRTTVSRSGLEEDEHYEKLARLWLDLAVAHAREEISRVAQAKGYPLSRASSTSLWLKRKLLSILHTNDAHAYIHSLWANIPTLVVERVEPLSEGSRSYRSLVSEEDLRKEEFWSLESRLVDSLGLISRDLGKELSLHEFMSALAPEFMQFQYSPLLPDAFMFNDFVTKYYIPERAEFSRRHQQTAIKWISSTHNHQISNLFPGILASNPALSQIVQAVLGEYSFRNRYAYSERFDLWDTIVYESPVQGDDEAVEGVYSRFGLIVDLNSKAAALWRSLVGVVVNLLLASKPTAATRELVLLPFILYEGMRNSLRVTGQLTEEWDRIVRNGSEIFEEHGLSLPADFREIGQIKIFNATSFWQDWSGARR